MAHAPARPSSSQNSPRTATRVKLSAGWYKIAGSSHIGFHIDQIGGDGLDGTITDASGQFRLDPTDLTRCSVSITLKAGSVTTGQSQIDDLLHSDAVFDAADHPDITFESSRVVRTGPKTARIEGTLTARGIGQSAVFDADLETMNKSHAVFHVVGKIERSPYGMGLGRPIFSNLVAFDMTLEGTR